ncbi:MAG: type 1 glutamine amidotransferase domain-containing protein [Desulfatibacillaceae bacterium]
MDLSGKRIAIMVEEIYNEHEFWYPYWRLMEAGARVVVVGAEKGAEYKGKYGMPATADAGAKEVNGRDFDGVIIPGGYAPDHMRRHPDMIRFVRDAWDAGKVVAAICHAGWMLASAGILKGKQVTSFFAIRDDMVNAGAQWVDEDVVIDGHLVTSRQPEDLPAFMRAFGRVLQK